jgi:hypothetical protein
MRLVVLASNKRMMKITVQDRSPAEGPTVQEPPTSEPDKHDPPNHEPPLQDPPASEPPPGDSPAENGDEAVKEYLRTRTYS